MRMEQHITLTEDELRDARKLTGITDPTALVRHVLTEYVKRLRLDRLAKGGFAPDFEGPGGGWHGFWAVNLYFGLGMGAVGLLIVYLPADKYNLIREIIGAVVAVIMNEWKDYLKYIRDAGASSARKIEYGSASTTTTSSE